MTPKQADQVIASGEVVTVRSKQYDETFSARFVRRDRTSLYSEQGGTFNRSDLELEH